MKNQICAAIAIALSLVGNVSARGATLVGLNAMVSTSGKVPSGDALEAYLDLPNSHYVWTATYALSVPASVFEVLQMTIDEQRWFDPYTNDLIFHETYVTYKEYPISDEASTFGRIQIDPTEDYAEYKPYALINHQRQSRIALLGNPTDHDVYYYFSAATPAPEPSGWLMGLAGFCMIGCAFRAARTRGNIWLPQYAGRAQRRPGCNQVAVRPA